MACANVLGWGAKKYSDENYMLQLEDLEYDKKLYAAALRHVFAWRQGKPIDDETNMHHVAHAAVDLLMLLERVLGREEDK